MSKIKIDDAGWATFSGYLGTLKFDNGVSERSPTDVELRRIAANIKVVGIDDDLQVGPAVSMVNIGHVSAQLEVTLKTQAEINAIEAEAVDAGYSEAALEEIAEKGGIKELRKIATEFNVKGVSIADMIKAILEAQSAKAA